MPAPSKWWALPCSSGHRTYCWALAQTFNLMVGGLENAYKQMKGYARQAAVARKREKRIREIFQKYVPKEVIDQFFDPDGKMPSEMHVLSSCSPTSGTSPRFPREPGSGRPGGIAGAVLRRDGGHHHLQGRNRGQVHRGRRHGVFRRPVRGRLISPSVVAGILDDRGAGRLQQRRASSSST